MVCVAKYENTNLLVLATAYEVPIIAHHGKAQDGAAVFGRTPHLALSHDVIGYQLARRFVHDDDIAIRGYDWLYRRRRW